MLELTKDSVTNTIANEIVQLSHVKGESVFITDPEGKRIEFKYTEDGSTMVFTKDEEGRGLAIEERSNGAKLYHISSDSTGLPSTHEIKEDQTEIIYFYDSVGSLQHFVEMKTNGDRVSTILDKNGSMYSIEQKQVGGIIFKAWKIEENETKEGLVWLHQDGDISEFGAESVVSELYTRFSKFLDGVRP